MWQLRIIIEISSRKELLDTIWSLPGGLGGIIPPWPTPSRFVRPGVVFWSRRPVTGTSTALWT